MGAWGEGEGVVAQSVIGRIGCTEWWDGSSGSRDGWPPAMSSKYSGKGLVDGGEALRHGP